GLAGKVLARRAGAARTLDFTGWQRPFADLQGDAVDFHAGQLAEHRLVQLGQIDTGVFGEHLDVTDLLPAQAAMLDQYIDQRLGHQVVGAATLDLVADQAGVTVITYLALATWRGDRQLGHGLDQGL